MTNLKDLQFDELIDVETELLDSLRDVRQEMELRQLEGSE